MGNKPNGSLEAPRIRVVSGTLEQERGYSLRELFPEECGLAAAINVPDAARHVYDCLMLQEHRGEHGAGIVSVDAEGEFLMHRGLGSVRSIFQHLDVAQLLPGTMAMGHNRYATRGNFDRGTNIQT
ncbi:MAG: hypothetical protein AAGJ35_11480 [Myxococcota bacterium]